MEVDCQLKTMQQFQYSILYCVLARTHALSEEDQCHWQDLAAWHLDVGEYVLAAGRHGSPAEDQGTPTHPGQREGKILGQPGVGIYKKKRICLFCT